MRNDLYEKAIMALKFISPDSSRDDWLKVLIALKSGLPETEAKALAKNWSEQSEKFDAKSFDSTWGSISKEGGINFETLIYMAKQNGLEFQSPTFQAGKNPQDIYSDHPPIALNPHFKYLKDKRISLPDSIKLGEYSKKPALIVPIYGTRAPHTDNIQSVLYITEDGKKAFHKGCKRKNGYFNLTGAINQTIIITEGLATAATIQQNYAPKATLIVAFASDNLEVIASELRARHQTNDIIIAADNDHTNPTNPGLSKAIKAARASNSLLAIPIFEKNEKGSDWNDRFLLDSEKAHSIDFLKAFNLSTQAISKAELLFKDNSCHTLDHQDQIERSKEAKKSFSLDKYSFSHVLDKLKKTTEKPKFILQGIALAGQITTIYSPPNHGKTLLVIWQLIEAIEKGDVKPKDVYYINADDNYDGLLEKGYIAEDYGFNMLSPAISGTTEIAILEKMRTELKNQRMKGKVFIFDTLKKFNDNMDKKSSTEFMKTMRHISQQQGAVILLTHVNKNRDKNTNELVMSGTSDINDDSDCSYMLERTPLSDGRHKYTFTNKKNRGHVKKQQSFIESELTEDASYSERLDAITLLNAEVSKKLDTEFEVNELQQKYAEETEYITNVLSKYDSLIQSEIIERKPASIGKHRLREALQQLTGKLWVFKSIPERKGAKAYSLIQRDSGLIPNNNLGISTVKP